MASIAQEPVSYLALPSASAEGAAPTVEVTVQIQTDETTERPAKKRCLSPVSEKVEITENDKKMKPLQERLNSVLICGVCRELPQAHVYQCANGHLMCGGCFSHIMADSRIKDETPTCAVCRVDMSKNAWSRNQAVESAIAELPMECIYCKQEQPRNALESHEMTDCRERKVKCKYVALGCEWFDTRSSLQKHEKACEFPNMSGGEILHHVKNHVEKITADTVVYKRIMNMTSLDRFSYNDVQLRAYHSDDFFSRLQYETGRFPAHNHSFVVTARLNDDQRDSHLTNARNISYQLSLRGKAPSSKLLLQYCIVRGPVGFLRVAPHIAEHEFGERSTDSDWVTLPLEQGMDPNRMLASASIECRVLIGLKTPKQK